MTFGNAVRIAGIGLALAVASERAPAQDLEAGKTPPQLFSSNCTACHRTPKGLAKGNSAGTVARFLSQHYTTGRQPAAALAAYLVSVGGTAPPPARERKPAEPQQRQAEKPEEKPERPSAREQSAAERRAARQAAAERAAFERAKREQRKGEPPVVEHDPDPVLISEEPVVMLHDRASSSADEERDWEAFAVELARQTRPPSPAPDPVPTASASAAPSGTTVPAASDAPAALAAQASGQAAMSADAAQRAAAAQLFSAPLP